MSNNLPQQGALVPTSADYLNELYHKTPEEERLKEQWQVIGGPPGPLTLQSFNQAAQEAYRLGLNGQNGGITYINPQSLWQLAIVQSVTEKQVKDKDDASYLQIDLTLQDGRKIAYRLNTRNPSEAVQKRAHEDLAKLLAACGNVTVETLPGKTFGAQIKLQKGTDGYADSLNVTKVCSVLELPTKHVIAESRRKTHEIGLGHNVDPISCMPPQMTLDDMREQLVFLGDGGYIAMRNNPNTCYPKNTFADYMLSNQMEVMVGEKRVTVPTLSQWLKDAARLTLHGLAFDPRFGEFCRSPSNQPCLNLYRPIPHVAPPDWETLVQPFLDHVEYLVPVESERKRFLDWLAHTEQKPGELPTCGYLMITETEGIGRNSLASILARVWTGYVATDINLSELLDAPFNGILACRLMAVVDEIREGSNAGFWRHAQRLKALITADNRNLKIKFGREREEHNCCRWLMFSNHWDAMPIAPKDRRLNVIANPTEAKPAEYYSALRRLIDDPAFISAVREWLKRRDISAFNPGALPDDNAAKDKVMSCASTEEEDAFTYVSEHYISDCITGTELSNFAFGQSSQGTGRALGMYAKRAGFIKHPLRGNIQIGGVAGLFTVWVIRNHDKWLGAPFPAIQQEIKRGFDAGVWAP